MRCCASGRARDALMVAARPGTVAGGQPRRLPAARRGLRALPRHPADRRQHHADGVLHQRGHLEARPARRHAGCWRSTRSSRCWTWCAGRCSASAQLATLGLGVRLFGRSVRRQLAAVRARARPHRFLGLGHAAPPPDASRDATITAEGVSVDFPLYHDNARSLKRAVFRTVSGRVAVKPSAAWWCRRCVTSASDPKRRPAGPDRRQRRRQNHAAAHARRHLRAAGGRVIVQGSLNALLEPNLGMNPELTGRENILLRGLYTGFDARRDPAAGRRRGRLRRTRRIYRPAGAGLQLRHGRAPRLCAGHRHPPAGAADGRMVPGR